MGNRKPRYFFFVLRSYKTKEGKKTQDLAEIDLCHSAYIEGQITLLQALFRLFENLEVKQLKFRELFHVPLR